MRPKTNATHSEAGGITTLAFRSRERNQSEQDLLRSAQRANVYLLLAIPVLCAAGYGLRLLSLEAIFPIVVFVSLVAIGCGVLFAGRAWRSVLVTVPIVVIAGVVVATLAYSLFRSRLLTAGALGVIFVGLLLWRGPLPLRFFRQWRLTDPRVTDSNRVEGSLASGRPSWLLATVLVTIITIVPWRHSTTLAILLVLLLSCGTIAIVGWRHPGGIRKGIRAIIADGRFMNHLFLAYPDSRTARPGEWTPHESQNTRKFWMTLLNGTLAMLVVVGLSFCCPWELAGSLSIGPGLWVFPPSAERPHDWLVNPLVPLRAGGGPYVWAFVVAFVLLVTLPTLVLLALYAPALLKMRLAFDSMYQDGTGRASDWEVFVHRLRTSTHETTDPETGDSLREADHLFMGVYRSSGAPVLLHRSILDEHMYISGQTGAGKTALGIVPLLIQIIRSGGDRPAPVVILDLKGDLALFNTAVDECAKRQAEGKPQPQKCLCFRTDRGYASNHFNPFRDINSTEVARRPIDLAELMVQALSLFHGDFYGASYYSKQHRDVLLSALLECQRRKGVPTSFDDLYRAVVAYAAGAKDRGKDAVELLATIHAIAQYEQLRDPPPGVDSIFMPELLRQGHLAYFWLPSQLTGMSVREIGKLAVYSLLTAAQSLRQSGEDGRDGRRAYLIIDEFQQIAAENMRVILQQARSFGVTVILANQDPADLRLPTVDLRSTVYTNTRVKQFFSLTEPREIETLEKVSGEELGWLSMESETSSASWPFERLSRTTGRKQQFRPRFSSDDARQATDRPNDSVLWVTRGRGFTQLQGLPHVISTPWPTTREEYERRLRTPWPRSEIRPGTATNKSSPDEHEVRTRADAERFQAELAALKDQYEMFLPPEESSGDEEPRRPKPKGGRPGRRPQPPQEDSDG